MNRKLGLLVGMSAIIITLALFGAKEATALCTPDMLNDWPDIPCGPIQLSPEKLRDHWQGYYKFKGHEWMEEKRAEIEQAVLSGKLEEWRSSISNYNVWVYYKITNNVPEVPPIKQFKFGIPINDIICKRNFFLVLKIDGTPACVKQETGKKLLERDWTKCTDHDIERVRGNPCGPSGSGVISFEPSTISCPNQNRCTISVEGAVLKSLPDKHDPTYHFFTNDNIGSIRTGTTGIPLEIDQDKIGTVDLHGKVIKLKGQMFLEPFSKIFVEDLQIVRDLIPALSYNITDYMEIERSDGKTEMVTMNELFQNPAKYYWKQVSVKGLLKERGAVGVPSIECISVNFEESQEFRFEAFRSPYVLEGIIYDNDVAVDTRLGIRLESGEEYKFVDWERLPPDLKDKNVVVDGMFQPTVSNSGICKAVLHPAGYILTTFDKITIVD